MMSNLPDLLPDKHINFFNNNQGKNRAELKSNQLAATNDYLAVLEWLGEYEHNSNTYKAYLKESKRWQCCSKLSWAKKYVLFFLCCNAEQ